MAELSALPLAKQLSRTEVHVADATREGICSPFISNISYSN